MVWIIFEVSKSSILRARTALGKADLNLAPFGISAFSEGEGVNCKDTLEGEAGLESTNRTVFFSGDAMVVSGGGLVCALCGAAAPIARDKAVDVEPPPSTVDSPP